MLFISKRKAIKELEEYKKHFYFWQKHNENFVKEIEENLKREPDNEKLKILYEKEKTSAWHWNKMVEYADELIERVQRA